MSIKVPSITYHNNPLIKCQLEPPIEAKCSNLFQHVNKFYTLKLFIHSNPVCFETACEPEDGQIEVETCRYIK